MANTAEYTVKNSYNGKETLETFHTEAVAAQAYYQIFDSGRTDGRSLVFIGPKGETVPMRPRTPPARGFSSSAAMAKRKR